MARPLLKVCKYGHNMNETRVWRNGTPYCSACEAERNERPGRKRNMRQRRLLRSYGITFEQYEAMLAYQEGKCAICHKEQRRRRLAVDHCHKTKRVRKLLCDHCNHGLGKFSDDPVILRRAAAYLESFQEVSHVLN